MRTSRLRVLVGAVVIVVAGCSGDGATDPETTPAIPSASTVDSSAPTSTSAASTTSAAVTTASPTTGNATTVQPSVSTAPPPPISPTPSTLIPPAPLETDPASPNNQRVVTPDQQPIIDAYRAGVEAENLTYARWPLDPASPELTAAPFTDKARGAIEAGIAERTTRNQVLDISGGLTLRPYVVEDDDGDPNRVFVWDCQIDATFWKDADTGDKAPPDAFPNAGPPGVEIGVVAVLVNVGGQWLLDEGGLEPQACA